MRIKILVFCLLIRRRCSDCPSFYDAAVESAASIRASQIERFPVTRTDLDKAASDARAPGA